MSSLLKSTALGLGLLAGVAAAAQAQSVSALPPQSRPPQSGITSGVTPASPPPVTSSTPLAGPKPGGGAVWQEEHYHATDQDALPGRHPYTMPGVGPKPGGG